MRIAMVSRYPPQKCGIAIYAKNYCDALVDLGHHVTIFAFMGFRYKESHVKPILERNSLGSYLALARRLSSFDIVIIQHEYLFYNMIWFPMFLIALKLRGVRVNIVMHTVAAYNDIIKRAIFCLWNTSFMAFTDNLIVHTKNARNKAVRENIIRPKKTSILPIPIEGNPEALPKTGAGGNLLAQGFVAEDKGYHLLVDAFGGVDGYTVRIIGTVNESSMQKQHDYYDMIKKKAKGFSNVMITDRFITEKEKKEVIEWSDYIILPYVRMEQSASLTTAWGNLRIPVCSDIVPLREETNGKYGIMFRSGDPQSMRSSVDSIRKDASQQKKVLSDIAGLNKSRSFRSMAQAMVKLLGK